MATSKYSVLERLDTGGMAEVYKGLSSSVQGIEKLVAIKRVLPHLSENAKFVRMFLDEARLAMHLTHANIVQVFDLGLADGAYFIVMEYVEGTNLEVILDDARKTGRRLPLAVSLYVTTEICKGLSYAHGKHDRDGTPLGIVHRDVSPPNILISRSGEVKLTDFGLAKAHSQVERTDPGIVKGKFSYLSPEAAYGEAVDHRSDIFAVGILLWELISGRRLFQGDSDLETLELVRKCRVPGLAGSHPDVGGELAAILEKALARDVHQRWQSARELGQAVVRYLFARGLSVTDADVAKLVGRASMSSPAIVDQPMSVIDRLISDQLTQFRSISSSSPAKQVAEEYDGSRPLSFDDLEAVVTHVPEEDPRTWAFDDADDPLAGGFAAAAPSLSPVPGAPRRQGSGPSHMSSARSPLPGASPPLVSDELAPRSPEEPAKVDSQPDVRGLGTMPFWAVGVLVVFVMLVSSAATYLFLAGGSNGG